MSALTSINNLFASEGLECSPKCCVVMSLGLISSIAFIIIGSLGISGAFPCPSLGWVTVGFAGGGFALNLALGNFKKRKFQLITGAMFAAILVTVGALGGTGILNANQVGWGIISTSAASIFIGLFAGRLKQRQISQQVAPQA